MLLSTCLVNRSWVQLLGGSCFNCRTLRVSIRAPFLFVLQFRYLDDIPSCFRLQKSVFTKSLGIQAKLGRFSRKQPKHRRIRSPWRSVHSETPPSKNTCRAPELQSGAGCVLYPGARTFAACIRKLQNGCPLAGWPASTCDY